MGNSMFRNLIAAWVAVACTIVLVAASAPAVA